MTFIKVIKETDLKDISIQAWSLFGIIDQMNIEMIKSMWSKNNKHKKKKKSGGRGGGY